MSDASVRGPSGSRQSKAVSILSIPSASTIFSHQPDFPDFQSDLDISTTLGQGGAPENPDQFYVIPRGVVLEYGPYEFHGVLDFRVERLQGMIKSLEKLGARVKLVTCTDHRNRVQVWYMDNMIFSCKIKDLFHGGDGEIDPLCIEAARAFDKESRKAVHGLRNRVQPKNKELLDPFCPCLNPDFFPPQDKADKDGNKAEHGGEGYEE